MNHTLRERLQALADEYARQTVTPRYGPDATPTPYERGALHSTRTHFLAGAEAALLTAPEVDDHRRLVEDDDTRCAVCGWTLAERPEQGCVRGNCSQRPLPDRFYAPTRARLEYAPYLDGDARAAVPSP